MNIDDADGPAPTIVNASVARTRRYLTQREVDKLIEAARKHGRYGHRDATMILIAYRQKSLVDSGKVKAKLPTALDSEHQQMLDELKAKGGKDFDSSYDEIQVKAHEDAVALFDAYAKGGDDPELKKWAGKTLPHLKEHLSMAQKLK